MPISRAKIFNAPNSGSGGFTLLELVVVIGIISVIVAVALPNLAPVIAFSGREGAARHLAGFGRSAMHYAALRHTDVTVKIDLGNQEYWAEYLPEPEPGDANENESSLFDVTEPGALEKLRQAMMGNDAELRETALDEHGISLSAQIDRIAQGRLTARAALVEHEVEGVFDDRSSMLDNEFSLDGGADAPKPEELDAPELARTALGGELRIASVKIGDETRSEGIVEIAITPLGLEAPVEFSLMNDDGDAFRVTWDPVTGGGNFRDEDAS